MNGLFQKIFFATGCAFELARGVIIFAVVLALVNVFIITINVVSGPSMEPNFHNNQYVLVDKLSYFTREPRRGEAVILRFPGDPEKTRYIKRIIGLPNETIVISDSKVYINGKQIRESYIPEETLTEPDRQLKLGKNEYYVMGDNRENSNDSRVFGAIERRFFVGLAWLVILPFNQAGLVPPQYY